MRAWIANATLTLLRPYGSVRGMTTILFALLVLFWGSAYLGIFVVLDFYPPLLGAAIRIAGATIIMGLVAWKTMPSIRLPAGAWCRTLLSGVIFLGCGFGLLFWGQQYIAPAIAAILIAATPIIAAILMPILNRGCRVGRNQWFGVVMGLLGLLLVFSPQIGADKTTTFAGLLAVLGTSLCYAVGTVMLQPVTGKVYGRVIFFWQGLMGTAALLLVSFLMEPWPSWAAMQMAEVANIVMLYLIIFPTVIAFLIFYYLIRTKGSVATLTVTFLIPLVALMIDLVALRQVPEMPVLFGAAVILLGTYRVQTAKDAPSHATTC
jgi:drug/metabolite transporter (DMT)-like permease